MGPISLSQLKDMSIEEAVPHIFRRPLLEISPQTPLSQLAVFLAIGPQIYVDGMTVLIYRKPVGRIGGKHILNYIRNSNNSDWSNVFASDLMEENQISVESIDTISSVLTIFKKTKFAFAPVMMKGQAETSISVRDLLPIIVDAKLSESCKVIASTIVLSSEESDLESVIDLMLAENVRNVVIKKENCAVVINDRKILEFLFSPVARNAIRQGKKLAEFSVGALNPNLVPIISTDLTISEGARLLTSIENSFLLFEDSILTPWDVVIKTTSKDFLPISLKEG